MSQSNFYNEIESNTEFLGQEFWFARQGIGRDLARPDAIGPRAQAVENMTQYSKALCQFLSDYGLEGSAWFAEEGGDSRKLRKWKSGSDVTSDDGWSLLSKAARTRGSGLGCEERLSALDKLRKASLQRRIGKQKRAAGQQGHRSRKFQSRTKENIDAPASEKSDNKFLDHSPEALPDPSNDRPELPTEASFISIADGTPSLRLGDLDLQCKLFPTSAWRQSPPQTYTDDLEDQFRVELVKVDSKLPANLLSTLMEELDLKLKEAEAGDDATNGRNELADMGEVYARLKEERSNDYPRMAGMPVIVPQRHESVLQVPIAPSQYGVALIREKKIMVPTAQQFASHYILNSLAVRVAYIYKARDGHDWIELHQRQKRKNATFSGAWDVSAAGYIDPKKHEDPSHKGRVSPSQACADELAKELRIDRINFPYRDNYYFFGVGRNDATGQIDLLGYCLGAYIPEPDRETSPFVALYDRCRLEPEAVAKCVLEKRRWVPTALLTLILVLEAYGGFSREEIESAFECCTCKLNLEP